MGKTEISLELKPNAAMNFICKNDRGGLIELTGTEEIGGMGNFFRPMENLLNAVAGCTAIDILSILRKQKQSIKHFKIVVEGERTKHGHATIFTAIQLKLSINQGVDEHKLQRAIELTKDKYCSVLHSLRPDTKIEYQYEFI